MSAFPIQLNGHIVETSAVEQNLAVFVINRLLKFEFETCSEHNVVTLIR